MSVTGYWYLGPPAPGSEADFAALRRAIARATDAEREALDRWSALWQLERVSASPPRSGGTPAMRAIEDALYRTIDGLDHTGIFGSQGADVITAFSLRKGSPVAGLFQAVGPRALILPGVLGSIALTAAEVPGALALARSVLDHDAPDRTDAVKRFNSYCETADGDLDGVSVLDALPAALRRSASGGLGLVALTMHC